MKAQVNSLNILTAVLLMLFASHASAICKWKDASGRVQYSDAPPPGVQCEGTIKAQPPISGTAPATTKAAPPSYQEKEMEFRKRRVEQEEAAKKGEQEKQQAETKRQNCEAAKNAEKGLSVGGRVGRYDDKGQLYYLGDEEIARSLAEARKRVDMFCK